MGVPGEDWGAGCGRSRYELVAGGLQLAASLECGWARPCCRPLVGPGACWPSSSREASALREGWGTGQQGSEAGCEQPGMLTLHSSQLQGLDSRLFQFVTLRAKGFSGMAARVAGMARVKVQRGEKARRSQRVAWAGCWLPPFLSSRPCPKT